MNTKKTRGAALKPALVHISLRVSAETLLYQPKDLKSSYP